MKVFAALTGLMLALTGPAGLASPIFYQVVDLPDEGAGDDLWRYDYFVANTTGMDLDAFEIYFDRADYDFNLDGLMVDPADYLLATGWDGFVAPDDDILMDDGFASLFAAAGVIGGISIADALASAATMQVEFIWRGQGTPGQQLFSYWSAADPFGDAAGSGLTRLVPGMAMAVPGTLPLLGLGLASLVLRRVRTRRAR